jgi:TolB protein
MRVRDARCRAAGAATLVGAGTLLLALGCGAGDASSGGEDNRSGSGRPAIAFSFGGRIYMMRPDGSGRRRLTGGRFARDAATDSEPAWSPDATTLAVTRWVGVGEASRRQIYLLDPRGGRARRLGVEGDVSSPAWSPDGRRIAFVRETDSDEAIVVADLDGGEQQVLQSVSARPEDRIDVGEPAWSPDGTRLAYTQTTLDRRHTFRPSLYVVDIRTAGTRLLARDAADAAWSPSGRRIAFASVRDRNGKRCWDQCHLWAELYVMDADGTDPVRLTHNRGDERSPSWSPDGRRIAFASDRNYPGVGNSEIYSIRPDGTCLTWLTNGSPASRDPAWRNGATSRDPGACGATRRRPRVEVDTRRARAFARDPGYWLGERYGNLLLGNAEVIGDRRSLPSYAFIYDDCSSFHARACPPGLQLQQVSVCSRSGESSLPAVDDAEYRHRVRSFAARGLLFVDIGQSDLSVVAGRAHVRIFHSTWHRRGRRQTLKAVGALRQIGRQAAPLPPPALPRTLLLRLRRTERAHGRFGSIGAAAQALGIPRLQMRRRLQLARSVRSLPRVRAVACPRG